MTARSDNPTGDMQSDVIYKRTVLVKTRSRAHRDVRCACNTKMRECILRWSRCNHVYQRRILCTRLRDLEGQVRKDRLSVHFDEESADERAEKEAAEGAAMLRAVQQEDWWRPRSSGVQHDFVTTSVEKSAIGVEKSAVSVEANAVSVPNKELLSAQLSSSPAQTRHTKPVMECRCGRHMSKQMVASAFGRCLCDSCSRDIKPGSGFIGCTDCDYDDCFKGLFLPHICVECVEGSKKSIVHEDQCGSEQHNECKPSQKRSRMQQHIVRRMHLMHPFSTKPQTSLLIQPG